MADHVVSSRQTPDTSSAIGRRSTSTIPYTAHKLEHVTTAKYLGVTITHDLSWNQHYITSTASRTVEYLRRNLQITNPQLKATAYQTLVKSSLEYASTVWDAYTRGNIQSLEMVQQRAAQFTLN